MAQLSPALAFAPWGRNRPWASLAFGRWVNILDPQILENIQIIEIICHKRVARLVRILVANIDLVALISGHFPIHFSPVLGTLLAPGGTPLPFLRRRRVFSIRVGGQTGDYTRAHPKSSKVSLRLDRRRVCARPVVPQKEDVNPPHPALSPRPHPFRESSRPDLRPQTRAASARLRPQCG